MAYVKKRLTDLPMRNRFVLDPDILLDGVPELLSMRKFAAVFYVDPMYIVRANKKGLVVMRNNSHKVLRIDTRKTLEKMAKHYNEEIEKSEVKDLENKFRTDRSVKSITKNKRDFVQVSVGPKTFVLDKMLPKASDEEMLDLEEKWKQLTGDEKMPDLQKHQVTKLLWNLRYMKITNMLLDAYPAIKISTMMMAEWGMTWKQAKRILSIVETDIIRSVEKRKGFLVGQAYRRYEKLFNEAMLSNDVRTATVINKEIISLYGIDKMAAEMLESKASEEDGHMSILAQIEAAD